MPNRSDPLAQVAALDGVGGAAAYARDSIDALLTHPAMRRDAAAVAAESVLRGARASAALAGADLADVADPSLQGALRAGARCPALARTWSQSPRQALATLHVLAAGDPGAAPDDLGRPRPEVDTGRLDQLMRLATGPTAAPGVVVAAIVHGELRTLSPFATANGLVARAAERIVLIARGVDPPAVSVPEVGHQASAGVYESVLSGYASGTAAGVAAWVKHCALAYAAGAEEGLVAAAHVTRERRPA